MVSRVLSWGLTGLLLLGLRYSRLARARARCALAVPLAAWRVGLQPKRRPLAVQSRRRLPVPPGGVLDVRQLPKGLCLWLSARVWRPKSEHWPQRALRGAALGVAMMSPFQPPPRHPPALKSAPSRTSLASRHAPGSAGTDPFAPDTRPKSGASVSWPASMMLRRMARVRVK